MPNDPALEVEYCEAWDPDRRAAAGVMPEEAARERDQAGAQYAVLLRASAQPVALIQVAWASGYLGVYEFDEQARRCREYDFRLLDDPGRLYWHACRHWLLGSPGDAEFSDQAWLLELTIDQDGRASQHVDAKSRGSRETWLPLPEALRTIRRAPFGDWRPYLATARPRPVTTRTEPGPSVPASQLGAPAWRPPAPAWRPPAPAWRPPAPLTARHLEALFAAGTRLRGGPGDYRDGEIAIVCEPHDAGLLRLPSGRLLAGDPFTVAITDREAFTVGVPPGDYPVSIGWAEWSQHDTMVTAVRVLITGEPASTWEMALLPGQEPRMVPDGGYFGFGVDSGLGAFLDATARDILPAALQERYGTSDPLPEDGPPGACAMWAREGGPNMLVYRAGVGDGSYPVWLGRDADARVVSFVADMLLLNDAEPASPAAPGPARTVLPRTVLPCSPARQPPAEPEPPAGPPAKVGDIAGFVDQITEGTEGTEESPATVAARAIGERGRGHMMAGRYEDALADLDRAVLLHPDSAWALACRGETYQLMERYAEALDDFTRAMELAPDQGWIVGGRGRTHRRAERYAEALGDLTRAIELDPGQAWMLRDRGQANQALERYEEALEDYATAAELDPDDGWVFGMRGETFRLLERNPEALADFTRAIEFDPDDAWYIGSRGQAYQALERYDEALEDYTRAIELDPGYAWVFSGRGETYQALGRDEEALEDYARAAELDPGYAPEP